MKVLKQIIGYILNPIGMLVTRHKGKTDDKFVSSYLFIGIISAVLTAAIILFFYL